MRIGLIEMKQFSEEFFPGVQAETFVQEVSSFLFLCFRRMFELELALTRFLCFYRVLV